MTMMVRISGAALLGAALAACAVSPTGRRTLSLVSEDSAIAASYLTRACQGGHFGACSTLGALYMDGDGVPKDEATAAAYLTKACDADVPAACAGLALLIEEGRGVPKNEARAVALYTKSCDGKVAAGWLE